MIGEVRVSYFFVFCALCFCFACLCFVFSVAIIFSGSGISNFLYVHAYVRVCYFVCSRINTSVLGIPYALHCSALIQKS